MTTAILLRLAKNPKLSINQTLNAMRESVEEGGVRWLPLLGQAPAAGRHEAFPYLLVAAHGKVECLFHILSLNSEKLTGHELAKFRAEKGTHPAFDGIEAARAWVEVGTAPELTMLGASLDSKGLGQGVNYVRLDQERRVWQRISVSTQTQSRKGPAKSAAGQQVARIGPRRLKLPEKTTRVLGIDLTASKGKASAACIIQATDSAVTVAGPSQPLYTDEDIIRCVNSEPWDCIAIDGPRREPNGWQGFVDKTTADVHGPRSRAAERAVHQKISSIFFFSPRAREGVRQWLQRSIALFQAVEALGEKVIEVYPHASFVALVSGTKQRQANLLRPKDTYGGMTDREWLLNSLLGSFTLDGLDQGNAKSHDLMDAAGAAATALCHVLGHSTNLGEPNDGGVIVVPEWFNEMGAA